MTGPLGQKALAPFPVVDNPTSPIPEVNPPVGSSSGQDHGANTRQSRSHAGLACCYYSTCENRTARTMNINLGILSALVIDDFQNMRATLRQMLITIGLNEVDTAARADEALENLRAQRYDIVLCDYNLGEGMDGQQLLEAAREEGSVGPATTFMMVTAENSTEMVMGALETLPDAYLTKPFTKDLLRARLARVLPRKAALQPVDAALRKKDSHGAVAAVDRLLAENPASADLLRMRADLCLKGDDLDGAETACRQALSSKSTAWAFTLLGQVEMRRGHIDEAERAFREAIESTPAHMAAHDGLAVTMEIQGRLDEAFTILHTAVEQSPKSLHRQLNLARLAEVLKKYDVAERAWRRAIMLGRQTGRDRPEWHVALIGALTAIGELRLAQSAHKNLASQFPGHTEMPWWTLAARLALLTTDSPDTVQTTALNELDALMGVGKPSREAAACIVRRLHILNETDRANWLEGSTN